MQPGLDELLAEHAAGCGRRYDTFLRQHLKSLSGVAAYARLRFSARGMDYGGTWPAHLARAT